MISIAFTKNAFLWCMSAVYLMAFASIYHQAPGLYGNNGILPIKNRLLESLKGSRTPEDAFYERPTLLLLVYRIGLDYESGFEFICILGILCSFICMVSKMLRDSFMFAVLWFLYLSIYQVGQTFMWFQWDILLLEAGFLTIIVAPMNMFKSHDPKPRQHDAITMWLVKWLLFRLMFASGIVKLTSQCPTWWGLTALDWHYESQCIPTPLAWYMHHLPQWFNALSTAVVYVIEIVLPFLFFAPIRNLRIFAAIMQIKLMTIIFMTGNYNFFNILTVVLNISLLDDRFFRKEEPKKSKIGKNEFTRILSLVVSCIVYFAILYGTIYFFDLRINTSKYSIESRINFTEAGFFKAVRKIMPFTIHMAVISLMSEILGAFYRCIVLEKSLLSKLWSTMQCVAISAIAIYMFTISLVPHTAVDNTAQRNLWPIVSEWHQRTDHLQITSSYGLFRRMTGVGGRPEIIIEGRQNHQLQWKAYDFLYKPGNLSQPPPFVAPHQPRLDWQMWFAALGSYQYNPWFLNLVYRLLQGKQEVVDLIGPSPFPDKPPKYIRAKHYNYHYTRVNSNTKDWWTSDKEEEYLPSVHLGMQQFMQILSQTGIFEDDSKPKKTRTNNHLLENLLKITRTYARQISALHFILSLIITAICLTFLS
ncbi:lipase maturation factor 2-like [Anneissia japonica]|uniref:lipase maturation factor 2-like n=1 Tax=Anneissia japonica TaxID=1529436 RepID=UPI0014256530|nr:lipase maturation factor 2-like [Anneissia japonica]